MSVNYATMLTENGGSNLRLLANRVDIQNWGTAQSSNLPLSTQIAASNHATIVSMSASNISVTANILPTACNVFDLGSSNYRFKDLYLSGSTINLDGLLISKDPISGGMKVTDQTNTPVATNTATVTATTSVSTPALTTTGVNINVSGKTLSNIATLRTTGDAVIGGNVTASNLTIIGDFVTLNTVTSNTEQMVITNAGTGPALKVTQTGAQSLAEFYDNESGIALMVSNNAYVGIGTTNPAFKLQVDDETNNILQLNEYNDTDGAVIRARRARGTKAAPTAVLVDNAITGLRGFGWNGTTFSGASGYMDICAAETYSTGSNGSYIKFVTTPTLSTTNYERVRITSDGYVGIGITNPSQKLHVAGTALISPNSGSSRATGLTVTTTVNTAIDTTLDQGDGARTLTILNESTTSGAFTNLSFRINPGGSLNNLMDMRYTSTGTTAASGKLIYMMGGSANTAAFTFTGDGNLGIGNTTPGYKLQVTGDAYVTNGLYVNNSGNATPALSIADNGNFDNVGTYGTVNITRAQNDTTRSYLAMVRAGSYVWQMGYVYNTDTFGLFPFNYSGSTTAVPAMSWKTDGNVGIGISNPGQKLDVSGSIRASGSIISTNMYGLRVIQGNYGSFMYNDGSATYFLVTASGDQYGGYSGIRPLYYNNASGSLTMGNGATINNGLNASGGVNIGGSVSATTNGLAVAGHTYLSTTMPTTNGLTRYWNFQNTLTDTIAASTFSVTGSVTYQSGSYTASGTSANNYSVQTTTNNYLSVASPIDQPPFTICFWFYPQSTGTYQRVMSLGSLGGTGGAMNVDFTTTNYFGVYSALPSYWTAVASSFPLSLNTWYHIAITISSTWVVSLYINGALNASATGTANFTVSRSLLFIGTNSDGQSGFMNARYDDFRVYNRVITATEVSEMNTISYVGIGNVNPAYKLDVSGDIRTTGSVIFNTNYGNNYIALGTADNATYTNYNLKISSWWGIGFPSYDNINRILFNTRNGGINTVGIIRADNEIDGPPSAYFVSANTSAGANAYAVSYLTNGSGNCVWLLNSTTRTGDGGINTATLRNDAGTLRLQSQGGNGITIAQTSGAITFDSTCSFGATMRQMINLHNSDYGIGVQSGTTYFRGLYFAWFSGGVHNDSTFNAGAGGTVLMTLDNGNGLRTNGDITAFTSFSDVRMKENVTELPSVLAKMRELRAVDFRWKDDIECVPRRGTEDVGFIAQEVEAIFPKLVKEIECLDKPSEKRKGLRYEKMAPYLVRAIQELDEKNQQLERELADLRQIVLSLLQK